MSGIQGISGALGDLYNTFGKNNATTGKQSIASIRDEVDQMANSGQLTTAQQRLLIGDGLQDMNATDPSYQPAGELGFQRSDTQSINLVSTLSGYGDFAQSHGYADVANTYQSLVSLFSQKDSTGGTSIEA